MSDRELLELAAKAAGIRGFYEEPDDYGFEGGIVGPDTVYRAWNPLADDGDALRLAVKLGIDIREAQDAYHDVVGNEEYHRDPYAATRRAIVRAAAEIGKGMK